MRRALAERGFTVLEAMVSLTVFLFILIAVFSTYESQRVVYARSERKVDVQQSARLAMAEITREMRMAGYFPENFGDPPPTPLLLNGFHVATDGELAVFGDCDSSGTSNVYLYCLDGNALRRQRAPIGTMDYLCATGEVVAENITSLRFTYYDETNAPIPDPLPTGYQLDGQVAGTAPDFDDTDERGAVRRVAISLTAREDHALHGPQIYTLTSDVWLRNGGTP